MKTIFAILFVLFAQIPMKATAQEETMPVATIIGHQFSFGATKREVFVRTQVLRDMDPATCDASAATVKAEYRALEAAGASRVNANSWMLASDAFCSTTLKLIPSQSVTVLGVCELTYDPASGVSASDQIIAACGL